MTKTKIISAEEFDRRFDDGEDMADFIIQESASKKVLVDFPVKFLAELDKEAAKIGIARTALIKVWLKEKLDSKKETA
jgi:hypothetical protein